MFFTKGLINILPHMNKCNNSLFYRLYELEVELLFLWIKKYISAFFADFFEDFHIIFNIRNIDKDIDIIGLFGKNHCVNTLHFRYRKTTTTPPRYYPPRTKIDRHLPPRTIVPSHLPTHQTTILQIHSYSIDLQVKSGFIHRFMIPVFRSLLRPSGHWQ